MKERIQSFDPRKVMYRDDFEIFHYRGSIPEEKELHHHDFYEVFFLLGGKVGYWVEEQTYNLRAGDLLLINPMVLHRPMPESENSVYERIVLWVNKAYLSSLSSAKASLSSCFEGDTLQNAKLLHLNTEERNELSTKLDKLVEESYSDRFASEVCAEGILRQCLVELNRFALNATVVNESSEKSSMLVSRVIDYIGKNYRQELSLDKLATEFFVSKYHLSHEFSREMGTGVYRYITLKRLLEARLLLLQGLPALEVGLKCGFKDYTNFYRAFKAEYGMSPSELKGD